MSAPVIKWPGGKWMLADWILENLPPHDCYVEPYFGSGAVFFTKEPAKYETINDLDGQVVNLFRTIREHAEELAWLVEHTPWSRDEYEDACRPPTGNAIQDAHAFIVRTHQAFSATTARKTGWRNDTAAGRNVACPATWRKVPERILAVSDRLKDAHIENRPALELIGRANRPDVLIYADPPYVTDTRLARLYQFEMTDEDHANLLDALEAHSGSVVLSGYASELYDGRLKGWRRLERSANAEGGRARVEVLWLNPLAARLVDEAHAQPRLLEVPA
jgi:DNA adenine methylase